MKKITKKQARKRLSIVFSVLLAVMLLSAVALGIYGVWWDINRSNTYIPDKFVVSRETTIPENDPLKVPAPTDVTFSVSSGPGQQDAFGLSFNAYNMPSVGFRAIGSGGSSGGTVCVYNNRFQNMFIGQISQNVGSRYYTVSFSGDSYTSGPSTAVNSGWGGVYGDTTNTVHSGAFNVASQPDMVHTRFWDYPLSYFESYSASLSPAREFGVTYAYSIMSDRDVLTGNYLPAENVLFTRFALNVTKQFNSSTLAYFRVLPVSEGETTPDNLRLFGSDGLGNSKILYYRSDETNIAGLSIGTMYSVPTKLVFYDFNANPVVNFYYFSPALCAGKDGQPFHLVYYGNLGVTRYNSWLYPTAGDSSNMYQNGYEAGYERGESVGFVNGQSQGYSDGYGRGQTDGYNTGYAAGVAGANDYSFLSLFAAVIDAPITAFTSLLNFEILGYNMSSFVLALISISIAIKIVLIILGSGG